MILRLLIRLALFEFRRGNYTNAIEQRSPHRRQRLRAWHCPMRNDSRNLGAMSLHHLGNHSAVPLGVGLQAKNLTETGFDLEFDMWHWRDWILLHFLLQEADSLTHANPPLGERSSVYVRPLPHADRPRIADNSWSALRSHNNGELLTETAH